jgi:hypothetical protein
MTGSPAKINISRLIVAFLSLAIVIGGSGIFFGLPELKPEPQAPEVVVRNTSAFIESVSSTEMVPSVSEKFDGGNLTQVLAATVGKDLVALNAEGPEVNEDFVQALTHDTDTILGGFLEQDIVYAQLSQIEIELAKETKKIRENIRVNKHPSLQETQSYVETMTATLRENLLNSQLGAIAAESVSPESANATGLALTETADELQKLEVPGPMLEFHMAALEMLIHSEALLALDQDRNDPLRAMLALERRVEAARGAIARFESQAALMPTAYHNETKGIFSSLSLISRAHAQWVVTDPGNTITSVAQLVEFIVQKLWLFITEKLKDYLVHKLVQQTITWIQGGGKPQFVTDWKGFLRGAANEEAGRFIESISPRLCQSFGPMVRVALLPVELAPEEAVSCTLDQVVANVQDFYNDFSQGGWLAYGAVLEPHNNIFGALIETSGLVSRKAADKKIAAEKEAEAGKGFLPTKQCVRYDRRSEYDKCTAVIRASCAPGIAGTAQCEEIVYNACNAKSRTPGNACEEYKTTTPGNVVADITKDSFAAPLLRIVNAEDFAGLINALINSGLTKLVNAGQEGLLGVDPRVDTNNSFRNMCEGLEGESYRRCKTEVQRSCNELPADMKQACLDSVVEESACRLGEVAMESGNASGVDPSGTPGYYCDADPFSIEETQLVRFACLRGSNGGTAFITANPTSCNDRTGEDPSRTDIGGGWTFDEAGGVFDINGEPVEFVKTIECPSEEVYVELEPGSYQAGAWTQNPSAGALVCALGVTGDTETTFPPAP